MHTECLISYFFETQRGVNATIMPQLHWESKLWERHLQSQVLLESEACSLSVSVFLCPFCGVLSVNKAVLTPPTVAVPQTVTFSRFAGILTSTM